MYIFRVCVIGGGNQITWRKLQIYSKSKIKLYHVSCVEYTTDTWQGR
jgi:hypothetical protein